MQIGIIGKGAIGGYVLDELRQRGFAMCALLAIRHESVVMLDVAILLAVISFVGALWAATDPL